MKTYKEMYDALSKYTVLDYEEVYVDERYVNTPYLKIEDVFDETIALARTLSKEEATKLIVHLIKSTEANVKCRFNILKDYRMGYAVESAKSATTYVDAADALANTDFENIVTTDPSKIKAILNKTKAVVAQFMTTPRTIVVYDRKPDYVPDQIQTTVSPSKIVDFNPQDHSSTPQDAWKIILQEHSATAELPTKEAYDTYMKNHRMVKEYIKNEPKSKNMYKHKGFDKTYNYVRETLQTKMTVLVVIGLVILGAIYFLVFY